MKEYTIEGKTTIRAIARVKATSKEAALQYVANNPNIEWEADDPSEIELVSVM
tara:strand:+ start:1067 stop:1225 length:159 start_codon:yes stop_codon:yes gene_type:complete